MDGTCRTSALGACRLRIIGWTDSLGDKICCGAQLHCHAKWVDTLGPSPAITCRSTLPAERQEQTGWGLSFCESECRQPPEPAVRPQPRRVTAVPGKMPHPPCGQYGQAREAQLVSGSAWSLRGPVGELAAALGRFGCHQRHRQHASSMIWPDSTAPRKSPAGNGSSPTITMSM